MNKGLTALRGIISKFNDMRISLKSFYKSTQNVEPYIPDIDEEIVVIETDLKNYQELLEKPCVIMGRTQGNTQAFIDTICKNYKEVKITNLEDEKKLKALEIIVEKKVDIKYLYYRAEFNVEKYNDNYIETLTQEECDLLKEVLL